MTQELHLVCANYFYESSLASPEALLDRYDTLTGWAEGVAAAGARVSVVQKFGWDAKLEREGVCYQFVHDWAPRTPRLWIWHRRLHRAVLDLKPDVVHVHGLQFAPQARALKRALSPGIPILLQDHANRPPRTPPHRWMTRLAMKSVDAVSFVSTQQSLPWFESGCLVPRQRIVELMEGSSRFRLESRQNARSRTGLFGDPVCLWVGHLNENKDPMTVLRGFASCGLPNARLVMIYGSSDLLPRVQRWLNQNPDAGSRVTLLGAQPHEEMASFYNSADFFLLGSGREGSGYAVLEAISCGVVPIVTDIPSFRVMTRSEEIGALWPVGNAQLLARALFREHSHLNAATPAQVRAFFDGNFRWNVIGQSALMIYKSLIAEAAQAPLKK